MKTGTVPEGLAERAVLAMGLVPTPFLDTHPALLLARAVMVATRHGLFEALAAKDRSARDLAERLPSGTSRDYGKPFAEVFKAVKGDFYAIDPLLFSPARMTVTAFSSFSLGVSNGMWMSATRRMYGRRPTFSMSELASLSFGIVA